MSLPPSNDLILELSKYVCHLYGYEGEKDVNRVRYLAFKGGKYDEEMLPPNKDSLHLHVHRAAYQCFIWKHATQPTLDLLSFKEYGWGIDQNGKVFVKWMNLSPAPDSVLEFVNCKCTKGCESNRCSCLKSGMKCTDVCKCTNCNNCKESSSNDSDDSDEDIYDFDEGTSSSDENEQ